METLEAEAKTSVAVNGDVASEESVCCVVVFDRAVVSADTFVVPVSRNVAAVCGNLTE